MTEYKVNYLTFRLHDKSESGKTNIWKIISSSIEIGTVKWFGHWRKYVFYPADNVLFDTTCLREISDFLSAKTQEHKEAR